MPDIEQQTPLQRLQQTKAYKRRASEWDPKRWDFTEWEECELEAQHELGLDKR